MQQHQQLALQQLRASGVSVAALSCGSAAVDNIKGALTVRVP